MSTVILWVVVACIGGVIMGTYPAHENALLMGLGVGIITYGIMMSYYSALVL